MIRTYPCCYRCRYHCHSSAWGFCCTLCIGFKRYGLSSVPLSWISPSQKMTPDHAQVSREQGIYCCRLWISTPYRTYTRGTRSISRMRSSYRRRPWDHQKIRRVQAWNYRWSSRVLQVRREGKGRICTCFLVFCHSEVRRICLGKIEQMFHSSTWQRQKSSVFYKMLIPKIVTHIQNSITLYPDRWGIITSMRIRDTELLYQGMLDETLYDATKSVRWGIPILFPNAGFLTDEQKLKTWWNLPQHGFARTNEWKIVDDEVITVPVILRRWIHPKDEESPLWGAKEESAQLDKETEQMLRASVWQKTQIIQTLSSSDVSDVFGYEWQGTMENTVTISDEWIELRYSIANHSDKVLPISFGLHPYWDVPLGDKSTIEWNFAWGDIIARDIENWSRGGTTRIDVPDDGIVSFTIPGVGTIELQLSSEFGRLWIWSLPDKNFVCVEPVMWDDGNIVRDPVRIPARRKNEYWIKIRCIV